MSKNRNSSANFHTIPFQKGYVKGYYERRNGRLVWISPYENSKDKHDRDGQSGVQETIQTPAIKPPSIDDKPHKPAVNPVVVRQENDEKLNFLLEVVVRAAKTIRGFEPGEIVKLAPALKMARSIVSELGYMDAGIAPVFEPPSAKQTKLSSKAARETAALAKELKRVSRRVTKSTLREKTQKFSSTLTEAL
jgi:hypothetical protein